MQPQDAQGKAKTRQFLPLDIFNLFVTQASRKCHARLEKKPGKSKTPLRSASPDLWSKARGARQG
jgi:hypothetical protein